MREDLSSETVSTIGAERRTNYALQPMSPEAFLALVTADQPEAPAYFTYDAVLNASERPTLETALKREVTPLSVDRVMELAEAGATLLDVRDPAEFAHRHLRGSINIGLAGQYATWAGTLLDRDKPIVIIAEPGRELEAAVRLGRIGFDQAAGYLDGGLQVLEDRPELLRPTEQTSAPALAAELTSTSSSGPLLLDVRAPGERQRKYIDGSISVPLNQLPTRLTELPRDRRLFVYCAGGYRSSIAASLLQREGFDQVIELAGGLAAWETQQLPLV